VFAELGNYKLLSTPHLPLYYLSIILTTLTPLMFNKKTKLLKFPECNVESFNILRFTQDNALHRLRQPGCPDKSGSMVLRIHPDFSGVAFSGVMLNTILIIYSFNIIAN